MFSRGINIQDRANAGQEQRAEPSQQIHASQSSVRAVYTSLAMDTAHWQASDYRAARDRVNAMSCAEILERLSQLPEAKLREMVGQYCTSVVHIAGQEFADSINAKIRQRQLDELEKDKKRFLDTAHPDFAAIAQNIVVHVYESVRIEELGTDDPQLCKTLGARIFLGDLVVAEVSYDCTESPKEVFCRLNVPEGGPTRTQWTEAIESFIRNYSFEEPPRKRQRTE